MSKFLGRLGSTTISKGIEDAGDNNTGGEETPLVDRTEHLIDTVEDELGELTNADDLAVSSCESFGQLVSFYAIGKDSLRNGGLNRSGIMLLQKGIESALKPITDFEQDKIYSSLESFGGAGSRERATRVSLEGLGDTIASWFKQIIDFLLNLGNKIKGVMVKMFNSAGRMKKLVASTKAKADALTGAANPKNYDDEGIALALHIAGVVPASASMVTAATAMAELVKVINTGFTKNTSSDSIGKITDFVGNFTDKAKIKGAVEQYLAMVSVYEVPGLANETNAEKRKVSDTNAYEITVTPEMLGGRCVWRAIAKANGSLLSGLESYGLGEDDPNASEPKPAATQGADTAGGGATTDTAPKTETKDYSSVKGALKSQIIMTEFNPDFDKSKVKKNIVYFEKADIIKAMDALEPSFDTIGNLNNAMVKAEEKRRKLTDAAKKASSTAVNDEDVGVKANASLAVDLLKAAAVSLDSFPAQAIGYIMTTTKNLVSHAQKSMSLYK
jgi:hypothetical protein